MTSSAMTMPVRFVGAKSAALLDHDSRRCEESLMELWLAVQAASSLRPDLLKLIAQGTVPSPHFGLPARTSAIRPFST
jgi:hypothetical protein